MVRCSQVVEKQWDRHGECGDHDGEGGEQSAVEPDPLRLRLRCRLLVETAEYGGPEVVIWLGLSCDGR